MKSALAIPTPPPGITVDRLRDSTIQSDECWLWQGARSAPNAYGVLRVDGRSYLAHRLMYALAIGPVPQGLLVCHRCNTKACIQPSHLYLATNGQNIRDAHRDGLLVTANSKKTACSICGGPYTVFKKHWRRCMACKLASDRRTRRARTALAARAQAPGGES
jgi:hypothetical protein